MLSCIGLSRYARAAISLQLPSPLQPGSVVRAVNPGTWIDPGTDFSELRRRCSDQGWILQIPNSVRQQWKWFSGTDAQRLSDLQQAWNDTQVDALLYLGAGWGSSRVLEAGFHFPKRSLWTIGFSDCSSLLLAQYASGSLGAIHASLAGPNNQWQRVVDLLSGRSVSPLKGRSVNTGRATGPLVVTNLTVATHLIGTAWFPSLKGALLVLEDVGEAPYRVDRMLTHWRMAGVLNGVAGIATGRFIWQGAVEPGDFTMMGILKERLGDLGVPLVADLPIGHGLPNLAMPIGFKAYLDAGNGLLGLS